MDWVARTTTRLPSRRTTVIGVPAARELPVGDAVDAPPLDLRDPCGAEDRHGAAHLSQQIADSLIGGGRIIGKGGPVDDEALADRSLGEQLERGERGAEAAEDRRAEEIEARLHRFAERERDSPPSARTASTDSAPSDGKKTSATMARKPSIRRPEATRMFTRGFRWRRLRRPPDSHRPR